MTIIIQKIRYHNNRIYTLLTNVPKYHYIMGYLQSVKRICMCDAYYVVNRNSYTIVLSGNHYEGAIRFCQYVLHLPWQIKENKQNKSIPHRIFWSKHDKKIEFKN